MYKYLEAGSRRPPALPTLLRASYRTIRQACARFLDAASAIAHVNYAVGRYPIAKLLTRDPDAPAGELYERDFYTWALRQAELVREHRLAELDLENVAEELESLGKEQAHKLQSALRVLLLHLLKWRHQPSRRSRRRRGSIVCERTNVELLLEGNPGLKPRRATLFAAAYRGARKEAAAQTGLPLVRFPEAPPFTLEEALDEAFWPEGGG